MKPIIIGARRTIFKGMVKVLIDLETKWVAYLDCNIIKIGQYTHNIPGDCHSDSNEDH